MVRRYDLRSRTIVTSPYRECVGPYQRDDPFYRCMELLFVRFAIRD